MSNKFIKLMSVSYTHLDVYKRQHIKRPHTYHTKIFLFQLKCATNQKIRVCLLHDSSTIQQKCFNSCYYGLQFFQFFNSSQKINFKYIVIDLDFINCTSVISSIMYFLVCTLYKLKYSYIIYTKYIRLHYRITPFIARVSVLN